MNLFERYSSKLKRIAEHAISHQKYEKAMAAIYSYCALAYEWNQFYTDDDMEEYVVTLSEHLLGNKTEDTDTYKNNKKTILFYDGFGFDVRGLAIIYLHAFIKLHYHIIWVTDKKAFQKTPQIDKVLAEGKAQTVYLQNTSYEKRISELYDVIREYKPQKAFFYTIPNDVVGAVVFCHFKNIIQRYQINLTDHAFWLGKSAFDTCIEFREYGAGISIYKRKIEKEKIRILPFYPYVNPNISFQGFPFNTNGRKIVFSGGALYKTLGGDNKYYQIVQDVLKKNEDAMFIYAGSGDDSELKKLAEIFGEERVRHIPERLDLYAFMEHIDVYLSTYPMIGGLMYQYAAMAGKVPVTLVNDGCRDAEGFLIQQESAGVDFGSVEEVVNEITKLLRDTAYRTERGIAIKQHVNGEEQFTEMLNAILTSDFEAVDAVCPDTTEFLKSYVGRFRKETVRDAIVYRVNLSLLPYFPIVFSEQIFQKFIKR